MADVTVLDRPVYGLGEAASLLGLRTDRVRRWLDGYESKGTLYEPVIRPAATHNEAVTWGEFVELGYLREYRKAGVSLQHLRPVVQSLRERFGTPYPLAHHRPYIDGKQLVLEIQQKHDIPPSIAMVITTGQEIMLAGPAERYFRKIDFAGTDFAVRLHPAGDTSPVVIDPAMNFGHPVVRGVSTVRLWELKDAGEPVDHIAGNYELDPHVVEAAIAYEEQQRSLAA
jgi:uncharacterized protein (DUF433 family)